MGELRAVFFEGRATVPVGAALETTASFNLSIDAPNGAPPPRDPLGNAKTHSTPPSRDDDGVEHK